MKKIYLLVVIVLLLMGFSACKQDQKSDGYTPHYGFTQMDEEASSFLADTNISNADKNNAVAQMADYALAEAEKYRALIKEEYKKNLDEYEKAGMYTCSYDDMCKQLDEYFDYLKDEYNENAEFYENQAFMIYGTGTSGASYKAHKQYECAKEFSDKAEEFYNELVN